MEKIRVFEAFAGEEWRDIPNYEGLYQVSNFGRVKGLPRKVNNHTGFIQLKERILNGHKITKGYIQVQLSSRPNRVLKLIHVLVAQVFIPNPNNLPQVNYKSEIKTENFVENLEWCDALYNINYGNAKAKISATRKGLKLGKPVLQIDRNSHLVVAQYNSSTIAMQQTGVDASAINKCCLNRPKFKTAGGFIWEYA